MNTVIFHYYDDESLGLTDSKELVDIDLLESHFKFEDMVEAAIRLEFPEADIHVCYGGLQDSICADTNEEDAIRQRVGEIASEVWQGWEWLVFK